MENKSFSLVDWLNEKVDKEKGTINFLSGKFKEIIDGVKVQFNELKDDSHYLVPIINGLHGDSMEAKGHPALIKMSFRYQSRDIGIEKLDGLIDLGEHDGKVIILIHGLMNDESIWYSNPEDELQRMGSFLEKQGKANILCIRYNTGKHISHNGQDLSSLLENLINFNKQKIKELYILSHSMGGLVTRSACHYAAKSNHNWLKLLKKVFLIGVPNEGSYLARVAHMTKYFLRKIDPTEEDHIAKLFEIRSNGIKDLSFGFLIDEDWQNPNYEIEKKSKPTAIYPVPNVEYYLIAATITKKEEKKRLFTFFGDGLVEKTSVLSNLFKENKIQSGLIHYMLFEGENHLSLLDSVNVQSYMLECMGF
jgi:pimeloyl-ACP methyl ester carboxylesterase